MNWRHVRIVFGKELLELKRNARAMAMLILLPALLFPVLGVVGGKASLSGLEKMAEHAVVVAVETGVPESARQAVEDTPHTQIGSGEVDARIRLSEKDDYELAQAIEIEINGATEIGQEAGRRLKESLRKVMLAERDEWAKREGLSLKKVYPRPVIVENTASKESLTGFFLGRGLAPILFVMLLIGGFYVAIDATVGEREKRTLQTLLCAPVTPASVAFGKWLAVSLVSWTAALLNLLGLAVTIMAGFSAVGEVALDVRAFLIVIPYLGLCALYTSAVLMGFAALTKTKEEAQTTLNVALLALVFPAVGAVFPGIVVTPWLVAIPGFGTALLLREIFAGSADGVLLAAGFSSALVYTVLAVAFARRAFTVESIMVARVHLERGIDRLLPFDGRMLGLFVVAGYFLSSLLGQSLGIVNGLLLGQVFVFLLVPILVLRWRTEKWRSALGLVRPKEPILLGLALLMVPGLGALSEWIARSLFEVPEGLREMSERIAGQIEGFGVVELVLLFALLPAVCEEVCFRGALLRGLSHNKWISLILSALLFSAFHMAWIRVPPTLMIGLFAGFMVLRTGSVFAGIAIHLLHNASAVIAATQMEGGIEAAFGATEFEDISVYELMPIWVYGLSFLAALFFISYVLRRQLRPADASRPV